MKKTIPLLFLFFFVTVISVEAQSIDQQLEKYNTVFPQEKVYIHFDNNAYQPGSLIGYKAYLMNGPEPSKLNRNFYTDWYDENGKLLSHQVSPIALSSAFGSFEIPKNYKGQFLYVTGYTQWMLNFDSSFLFRKKITVLQSDLQLAGATKAVNTFSIQFLPEGGNLVANLQGAVAFKATDKNGMPFTVSGLITNDKGEKITTFQTLHDGMGKFSITPKFGETLTASWTAPDGSSQKTILPQTQLEGISLQLTGTGMNRSLEVERSPNFPVSYRKLTMLLTINQQTVMKGIINLEKQDKLTTRIPVYNLPSGTATLTILAPDNIPVSERLFFIDNEEYRSAVDIRFDTIGLDKRAKNSYEIQLPDSVPANMSLAITNDDVADDSAENIMSVLLLSSDIKGYVHNPSYYFYAANDSAKYYLDLVMLTNGWRRISWKKVLDT